MTVLQPLQGVRPKPEEAQQIVSGEYDFPSLEEAKRQVGNQSKSFVHVLWPEVDLPKKEWNNKDLIFQKAAENFQRLEQQGVLIQDDSPSLYIYRQQVGQQSQTGIIGGASIDDYFNNIIKIHEQTREHKKNGRIRHVKATNIHAAPVMLFYNPVEQINQIVRQVTQQSPLYSFYTKGHPAVKEKAHHELWPIHEHETIQTLQQLFAEEVKCAYIADGHHRSAAAAEIGKELRNKYPNAGEEASFHYFLSLFFPAPEITILPYNRVVKDLNGYEPKQFLKKVQDHFEVRKVDNTDFQPSAPHHFGLFLEGDWYELRPMNQLWDSNDPVSQLDVALLQRYILGPLLGIEDPRTDKRIDFVSGLDGPEGVGRCVQEQGFEIGFALYPVTIQQLMAVADAGKVMPPKSTWIEPKLVSGLILQKVRP